MKGRGMCIACGWVFTPFQAVLQFLRKVLNEEEEEKEKKDGETGKEEVGNWMLVLTDNQFIPFLLADKGSSEEELSRLRLPVISKKNLVTDSKLVGLLVWAQSYLLSIAKFLVMSLHSEKFWDWFFSTICKIICVYAIAIY